MFDKKSDYALNKLDPDAIVYKSASGIHIRLTRADFASEEVFLRWKDWSDQDYHTEEKADRLFCERCSALIDAIDSTGLSAEDTLMAPLLEAEKSIHRADLISQIKLNLTEKQYRRLCLYYLDGLTESEIAALEGVGQRRISTSLVSGKNVLKKILKIF